MPTTPKYQYTADYLRPIMDSDNAKLFNVQLRALATYAKGTWLGQVVGTGTAVNEVQSLAITGTPTGGSIRLQYGTQVTAAIAYNAAAADVQAALEALSSVGTGNVVGTGGALPGSAVTLTFGGELAGLAVPLITVYSNSLTGGTNPAAAVTQTTQGKPAYGFYDAYNDALANGLQINRCVLQFPCTTDRVGKINYTGGEWNQGQGVDRGAPAYFSGTFKTADTTGLDTNGITDIGGHLLQGTTLSDVNTILTF